jgi:hypothetical protein
MTVGWGKPVKITATAANPFVLPSIQIPIISTVATGNAIPVSTANTVSSVDKIVNKEKVICRMKMK